jgi:isoquinoline 1-oxidoreductase subunit beta
MPCASIGTNAAHIEAVARTSSRTIVNGNVNTAFDAADRIIEAAYEFPYLAHATLEPMNCVAQVTDQGCELWYGAQLQTGDQGKVAETLALDPANVKINMLYAGGSFGRRADRNSDYVVEAARIARAVGGGRPVKLVWTREDDMRAGAYRPLNYHVVRGALDRGGRITAWHQRIVGQAIIAGTSFSEGADALDKTTVEGASTLPYAIPNVEVDVHNPEIGVPVLWWRSVGHSHTAFSTETFLDELAHAAGADPLALRLSLLAGDPRRQKVVRLAAHEAGWDKPLPKGRGRGIAVHQAYGTCVAEVAEVSAGSDGRFKVDRVTIAVDCGIAVNPDIVRAQMQGGMGFGLSAALGDAITLSDGVVQQDNFDTYPVLRISQMPEVAVHIVPSSADPTGVGEPGVPPIAPAVANALFAATGIRHRRLPLIRVGDV